MWNHYDTEDCRSNNRLEAKNLAFNGNVGPHPIIWIFISKFQEEEARILDTKD